MMYHVNTFLHIFSHIFLSAYKCSKYIASQGQFIYLRSKVLLVIFWIYHIGNFEMSIQGQILHF
nr:MAG TPA: hypothetical protein [Caudoviricetes sp.]